MSTEDNQIVEDADVAIEAVEVEEVKEAEPPPAKRRGRPAGSKNKIKVEVVAVEEEEEPQPIRQKKPRARQAPSQVSPQVPEALTPVDTSILILNALREHQQQRAARKSAKYASWFA